MNSTLKIASILALMLLCSCATPPSATPFQAPIPSTPSGEDIEEATGSASPSVDPTQHRLTAIQAYELLFPQAPLWDQRAEFHHMAGFGVTEDGTANVWKVMFGYVEEPNNHMKELRVEEGQVLELEEFQGPTHPVLDDGKVHDVTITNCPACDPTHLSSLLEAWQIAKQLAISTEHPEWHDLHIPIDTVILADKHWCQPTWVFDFSGHNYQGGYWVHPGYWPGVVVIDAVTGKLIFNDFGQNEQSQWPGNHDCQWQGSEIGWVKRP